MSGESGPSNQRLSSPSPKEEEDLQAIRSWIIPPTDISPESLRRLNIHLSSRTTLLGAKASSADVIAYKALRQIVKGWTDEQRSGEHGFPHITRFVDFVQHSKTYNLQVPQTELIAIDPDKVLFIPKAVDAKAEKERKKKEAAAAKGEPEKQVDSKASSTTTPQQAENPGSGVAPQNPSSLPIHQKKEKSKKEPKPNAALPKNAPSPLSPAQVDLRVGHILKAVAHPDADSLYVSTIACGDPAGSENTSEYEEEGSGVTRTVRTVCSGLAGLVPLEQMQGRRVVVVCNLKPVTMRGIKSAAMVLAASPKEEVGAAHGSAAEAHKGPVELVDPPEGAAAGQRCWFEGFEGVADKQLNPKKKTFEMLQPGFGTSEDREVVFDAGAVQTLGTTQKGRLVTDSGGACTVRSLSGATVR